MQGATCTDNYDATCSVTTGGDTVDITALGTYTVTYNAVDAAGNPATEVTRTVNVTKGDSPVITLTGNDPETVEVNTTYTDAGATASDTEDGDITGSIVVVGDTIDTTTPGSHTVTYNVTDSHGNHTTQVTRTVNVTDTQVSTKPVYRFWSNKLQSHFYTISEAEKEAMTTKYAQDEWRLEGIVYNAIEKDTPHATPVYRFWSDEKKSHFYTASKTEKDKVIANYPKHVWRYEGIAYYAYDSAITDSRPVYRFWSDEKKSHFYTASEAEKDKVIANYPQHVWRYEAIAWYVPK